MRPAPLSSRFGRSAAVALALIAAPRLGVAQVVVEIGPANVSVRVPAGIGASGATTLPSRPMVLPSADFARDLSFQADGISFAPGARTLAVQLQQVLQAQVLAGVPRSHAVAAQNVLVQALTDPLTLETIDPALDRGAAEKLASLAAAAQNERARAELNLQAAELQNVLAAALEGRDDAFSGLFDGLLRRGERTPAPGSGAVDARGGWDSAKIRRPLLPISRASAPGEHARDAVPVAESPAKQQGFLRRNVRDIAAYATLVAVSASAFKAITVLGRGLVAGAPAAASTAATVAGGAALLSPLPLFLLQVALIIGVCKVCSLILSRVGQPAVMGQVIGGLVLGPSLFGLIFPLAAAAVFPAASLMSLKTLSQLGLIVFMFTVGQELDLGALKKQSGAAGLIAHASILIPFVLGAALSLALFTGFAPVGASFLTFCLFSGIAMSITAFPVLAHILHEKGMTSTPLGSLALGSAAINDITGWALLALVLAVATGGSTAAAAQVLGLTLAYLGAMFGAIRPLFLATADRFAGRKWYRAASFAAYAALLALSAFVTDAIGIHALFGAFIAGVVMPRGAAGMSGGLTKRIQGISGAVLLPVFFALTGLRTHLGLLTSPALWVTAALVVAVAVAGKLGGGALAARWSGLKWRDSLSMGALMNTRGLMELVVLNIGYDKGIISGPLFTIFVLMAIATTMMTGPLLSLFSGTRAPDGTT